MEELGVSQMISVDFRKKGAKEKPAAEPESTLQQTS